MYTYYVHYACFSLKIMFELNRNYIFTYVCTSIPLSNKLYCNHFDRCSIYFLLTFQFLELSNSPMWNYNSHPLRKNLFNFIDFQFYSELHLPHESIHSQSGFTRISNNTTTTNNTLTRVLLTGVARALEWGCSRRKGEKDDETQGERRERGGGVRRVVEGGERG